MRSTARKPKRKGSRVGDDLVEAFEELAAFMRGEIELEGYDVADGTLKASPTKMIRHMVARRAPAP